MAFILCIETSTNICSVALTSNGSVISFLEETTPNSHASVLTVLIDKLLKMSNFNIENINAVAVSSGPGSYTGLRIGVSVAKGICFALNKPLISLASLQVLTAATIASAQYGANSFEGLLCPMIDARRMEVYSALYDPKLNQQGEIKAEIINSTSYSDILDSGKIVFSGNGSFKGKGVINHKNAVFIDNIDPSAKNMAGLANNAFENKIFEDVAYFEPFYLKDFIATIPKRKVL